MPPASNCPRPKGALNAPAVHPRTPSFFFKAVIYRMQSENATLILSSTSTTNPCVKNAAKTQFTWSNINLKNIIGPMWDKYEMFCLKVVSFSTVGAITFAGGSDTGIMQYNIAGLTWENVHYDTAFMSKEWVPLGVGLISPSGTTAQNNYWPSNTGQSYNFYKGSPTTTIQIFLTNLNNIGASTFGTVSGGNTYNDIVFNFTIEPVVAGKMNECAFFGFNMNPSITTQVGRTVTASKEYSYASFDMLRLCRGFWDKHENFEIQAAFASLRGITASGNGRIMPIQFSGLEFTNLATKNSNGTEKLGLTTENAIVTTIVHSGSGSTHTTLNDLIGAPIQFKKDQNTVNLGITFKNNDNTGLYSATPNGMIIGFFIKPIYEVEKATLYLNPGGLTTTQTNLGITNANYTEITFNNIDMRNVCRSMWLKYNKFNIFLSGVTSWAASTDALNGSWILQMNGFNFINQTAYITGTGQTQTATIGSVFAGTGAPISTGNMSSYCTTFYKTQDLVNLTLRALPLDPATPFTNQPLQCAFTFTIVGVPDDE